MRILEAGNARRFGPDDSEDPSRFDECFGKWLRQEEPFAALRPEGAGSLRAELRLAVCDRPLMNHGMTIRKEIFEAIENEFELHDATMPAFVDDGGCFSLFTALDEAGKVCRLHIVVKAVQKVEITNCLMSLTYTVSRRRTNAFACGDSLILGQGSDEIYGNQQEQLLHAAACCGKHLWGNPLLLPVALLQMCTKRALIRTKTLESRLHRVERALGVVNAGWVVVKKKRPNWPMDIDIKRQTRELHSTLPQILFLKGVVQWQKRYAAWLVSTTANLQAEHAFADHQDSFSELKSTVELLASSIDGMLEFFEGMEGRTQSQINLLFSVVGQRDAINTQKANNLNLEVARSTKEDSISMTTFTFITALFLPPTFIATMFSMSMFDWGMEDSDEVNARVLSRRFWIFWVVALPLTILTLGGWYGWYGYANRAWQRKLDRRNGNRQGMPENSESDTDEAAELYHKVPAPKDLLRRLRRNWSPEAPSSREDAAGEAIRGEKKPMATESQPRTPFQWLSRRLNSPKKPDAV